MPYTMGINVMQVPRLEVLEHVSSVLMNFGFCPSGEGIDVKNLYGSFCIASNIMISHFNFLDYVIILPLVPEAAPMTAKYLTESHMKVCVTYLISSFMVSQNES